MTGLEILVGVLLLGVALSIALYWASYFRGGGVRVVEADWYRRFQDAFVAADVWLAVAAIIAAVGLLTGLGFGHDFALVAASALIFLALLDVAFNARNGLYALVRSSGAMRVELFINVYALVLGAAILVLGLAQAL